MAIMAKDNGGDNTRNRNERLKENYQKLRKAGYSAAEATRLRGAGDFKIKSAIRTGTLPPVDPIKKAARTKEEITPARRQEYRESLKVWRERVKDFPPYDIQKGKIIYENPPENKTYYSKYSYIITYQVIDPQGNKEWKVITITSDRPLYKKDLWQIMNEEIFPPQAGKYNTKIVRNSYALVSAYLGNF
jgi:hypothetical protein